MDAVKNFSYSLVATPPSPATSGTSLVVTAGQGALFPTAPFDATIWPAGVQPLSTNAEIVRVTAVSTDTFTITRAQYGTTAQSITAGYQIAQTIDANLLSQLAPLSGATFTGEVVAPDFSASGLGNATSGARFVGGTASGPPTQGTYLVGDYVLDHTSTIWSCVQASATYTVTNSVGHTTYVTYTTSGGTAPKLGSYVTITGMGVNNVTGGLVASSNGTNTFTVNLASSTTVTATGSAVTTGNWSPTESQSIASRSAAATAALGEISICTGSTAFTITLPTSPVSGSQYSIINNSSATITLSGPMSAQNTTYTTYTIAPGEAYGWVYDGTSYWYNTWTTDITNLVGILPTANGGTGLSGFTAANNALYSTSSSALTAGTLPVLAGGTGVTTSTGSGSNVLSTSPSLTTPLVVGPYETVTISGTALSGSTSAAVNISSAAVYYYTANPTAAWALNITNAPTTTGQSATVALLVNNGSTAYLPLAISVNGYQAGASSSLLPAQGATNNGVTSYYQSGTAWSAADVSTLDVYTLTVICTGSNAWTLLLGLTKF